MAAGGKNKKLKFTGKKMKMGKFYFKNGGNGLRNALFWVINFKIYQNALHNIYIPLCSHVSNVAYGHKVSSYLLSFLDIDW